jgi:chromate transporter
MITMTAADWLGMFMHFASLSILAVGGAITTAPDMQRFLVVEHGWLSHEQFTSSIALAQAAPGPNILFVPLLGWNVGLNAAGGLGAGWYGLALAMLGVVLSLLGIMLPSTVLTMLASRWGHRNRDMRAVRAFKQGMAPVVIALLVATGWILAANSQADDHHLGLWAVAAATTVLVWKTRIHLLWLLGAGALAGALGWI